MSPFHLRAFALLALLPAAASCSALGAIDASKPRGDSGPRGDSAVDRLSLYAGGRSFADDSLWDPVDAEAAVGLEFSSVDAGGLGLELGLLGSIGLDDGSGDNTEVSGAAAELYAGVRGSGRFGAANLVIGLGASLVAAGIDNDTTAAAADDEDLTTGFYGHVGLLFDLGSATFIGVDVRALGGTEVEFGPLTGDANYIQAALVLGAKL